MHYRWLDSSHDNSTRKDAVMRLILWLTPPETCVPFTVMEAVSMLKAVMLEAAVANTFPI